MQNLESLRADYGDTGKLALTPPREIFETGFNERAMRATRLVCNPNLWTGSSTSICKAI
jgi:hypothetical protein